MTTHLEIPMFDDRGRKLTLTDVLNDVPPGDRDWSVLDFYGVGSVPGYGSMIEFEDQVRDSPLGVVVSDGQLRSIADSIIEVMDCLIVSYDPASILDTKSFDPMDKTLWRWSIHGDDSTTWIIDSF